MLTLICDAGLVARYFKHSAVVGLHNDGRQAHFVVTFIDFIRDILQRITGLDIKENVSEPLVISIVKGSV